MSFFSLLLLSYPRDFRLRFGAEMLEYAYEDRVRAAGAGRLARWVGLWGVCFDLVVGGLSERWSPTWIDESMSDREQGMGMMMSQWIRDLRYAARALRKSPGFAITTVVTLALALGANAGIFSVVDAVLLEPLPYADADRLVGIGASAPGSDFPEAFGVSAEFFVHYRDEATQLVDLATFNAFTATVRADERVERLMLSMPSMSFFGTLGVSPAVGRLPREGEGGRVAVISHGLWTTWFGADPAVIGRSYSMAGESREIVGIMAPDFRFPDGRVVAWIPTEMQAGDITPGRFGIRLVGRMSPDADHASLARELTQLARRLPELYGGSANYARVIEQHVATVRSVNEMMFGPVSAALWVLMGSVLVVLLIACANVANLFAVRAESRGRDLAVRCAIGAARGQLIRAQLSEAVVIAALAGVVSVVLAALALPAYLAAVPDGLPRIADVHLSGSTLLFTVAASGLAALLCGLTPAIRSSKADLARLRDGARGSTRRRHWGRDGLVVIQTALALVLLVGSGLLIRSFEQLKNVDPGYDTEDILTFQFAPEQAHLVDGPTWAQFHLDVMARIRAIPGVDAVGIVENVPLDETPRGVQYVNEDQANDTEAGARGSLTFAGGDYFEAMGIDLIRGRGFTEEDIATPGNVVVSASMARTLWPDEDPIGRRLRTTTFIEEWHTVVGVVGDVVQIDLREAPEPLVYYPLVGPTPESWRLSSPGYVVRSARADVIAPEIRELIREVAPNAPMYRVYTVGELAARSTVQLSFTMLTLAVVAGLALILGAIGLYGILSYVVAERTQEIGVRMALGAEAGRVRRMVVGQGVRVVVLGIGVGLVVAFAATRVLSSMLYGVSAVDAGTFGGMAVAMAVVGMLASYIPARRASRVDPIRSMRGV